MTEFFRKRSVRGLVGAAVFLASVFIGGGLALGWVEPISLPPLPFGPLTAPRTGPFMGNVGIQATTTGPASKLAVAGTLSVGPVYFGSAAAANGMILEGKLGVGETDSASPFFSSPIAVRNGGISIGGVLQMGSANSYVPRATNVVSIPSATGEYMAMALGSDGLPMLSFYRGALFQFFKCTAADCSSGALTTISSSALSGPDHAIINGPDGFPMLGYNDSNAPAGVKIAKCADLSCLSFWSPQIIEAGATNPSVRISPDGFPIVAYVSSGGALKVAKCLDISCVNHPAVQIDTGVGPVVALAIGYDGFPVIAYHKGSDLRFARCSQNNCSAFTLTAPLATQNGGDRMSITIGNDGFPVISFSVADAGGSLGRGEMRILHCGDVNCTPAKNSITTLDFNTSGNNTIGPWHSLTLGANGNPIVVYPDFNTGNVNIAVCGDSLCSLPKVSKRTETVLDAAALGTSVMVGSDGLPVLLYRDNASQIRLIR